MWVAVGGACFTGFAAIAISASKTIRIRDCIGEAFSVIASQANGRSRKGAASLWLLSPLNRKLEVCATLSRLHPAAQHFRHAPGLGDAPAGVMGFAGIEHFADCSYAVVIHAGRKVFEKFSRARFVAWMNF